MTTKQPVWTWTDAVMKSDIQPLTKLVCLNISRYFSSAGKGWRISVAEMIKDTGLSNRSIATHLQLAADAKLLIIKREPGPHGQRGVTTYIPSFPEGFELAREAEVPPREPDSRGLSEPDSRGLSEPSSRGPSEPASLRPREPGSRQVSSHVSHFQKGIAPDAVSALSEEAGNQLIPFSCLTDTKAILEDGAQAAAKAQLGIEAEWLPFEESALLEVKRLGLDVGDLVKRCLVQLKSQKIKNPSGYLVRMARGEVAKKNGVPVSTVARMTSRNRTERTLAVAEAAGLIPDLRTKSAAAKTPNGAALMAAIRNRVSA